MTNRTILLLTATAACVAIVAIRVALGPAPHEPAAAARDVARAWRGATVELPRGWKVTHREADAIVWSSPGRRSTVTLGEVAAAPQPLLEVVRASSSGLRDELPGYRAGRISTREDGRVVVNSFSVQVGIGRRMQVVQAWRRDAPGGRDLVATSTFPDGADEPVVAIPATGADAG